MVKTMTRAATQGAARLHAHLAQTATGRRWERIYRTHEGEIDSLLSIHTDLRDAVIDALTTIRDLDLAPGDDATIPAVSGALESARHVLDGFVRLGSFELGRDARTLRDELDDARAWALLGHPDD